MATYDFPPNGVLSVGEPVTISDNGTSVVGVSATSQTSGIVVGPSPGGGGSSHVSISYPYGGETGGNGVWSSGSVVQGAPVASSPSHTEVLLQELLVDAILRRIPARRIKALRQDWFVRYLEGENVTLEVQEDGSVQVTMWDDPLPGMLVGSTFSFVIMADSADRELLLANRMESVTYICRGLRKSPTQVITEVEKTAAPLERLAQAADDE